MMINDQIRVSVNRGLTISETLLSRAQYKADEWMVGGINKYATLSKIHSLADFPILSD